MKKSKRRFNSTQRMVLILFPSLLALFCISCDYEYTSSGDYKWVAYNLHGTWERTEAAQWLDGYDYGKLVIDYDTITITGPVTRLNGYTRGVVLSAYTEETSEGRYLHIKDKGEWQTPVAYNLWTTGGILQQEQMLTLGSGDSAETFKLTGN